MIEQKQAMTSQRFNQKFQDSPDLMKVLQNQQVKNQFSKRNSLFSRSGNPQKEIPQQIKTFDCEQSVLYIPEHQNDIWKEGKSHTQRIQEDIISPKAGCKVKFLSDIGRLQEDMKIMNQNHLNQEYNLTNRKNSHSSIILYPKEQGITLSEEISPTIQKEYHDIRYESKLHFVEVEDEVNNHNEIKGEVWPQNNTCRAVISIENSPEIATQESKTNMMFSFTKANENQKKQKQTRLRRGSIMEYLRGLRNKDTTLFVNQQKDNISVKKDNERSWIDLEQNSPAIQEKGDSLTTDQFKEQYSILCRLCKQEGLKLSSSPSSSRFQQCEQQIINPCACNGEDYWVHASCLESEIRMSILENQENGMSCKKCQTPYNLDLTSKVSLHKYKDCMPCFITLIFLFSLIIYFILQLVSELTISQVELHSALLKFYIIVFMTLISIAFIWVTLQILQVNSLRIYKYNPSTQFLKKQKNSDSRDLIFAFLQKTKQI